MNPLRHLRDAVAFVQMVWSISTIELIKARQQMHLDAGEPINKEYEEILNELSKKISV